MVFFPMQVAVDRLKLLVLVCWGECQAHKHFTTVIYSCSKVYNNDLKLIINIKFYPNFSIFSRLKALALPSILIRPLGLWIHAFQLSILIIYVANEPKVGCHVVNELENLKSDFVRNIHLRLYSGPFGCRVPS